MKKLNFLVLVVLVSCSNMKSHTNKNLNTFIVDQSKGYDSIEELYRASIEVIKSKDSVRINNFIDELMPDRGTIRFMSKRKCEYRGIPNYEIYRPNYLDSLKAANSKDLFSYSHRLDKRLKLEDLRFEKFERDIAYETLGYYGCPEVLVCEPFGVCSSNSVIIRFQLGELLKVNNKWKSFTDFKLR